MQSPVRTRTCPIGEIPAEDFHRREAQRFRRLGKVLGNPALKQKLDTIAARHYRLALEAKNQRRAGGWRGSGKHALETYSILFLQPGKLATTHDFEAETDIEALVVAYTLLEASSDLYDRFELWRGPRVIVRSADRRGPKLLPHIHYIADQIQDQVLQNEETLLQSRQAIAESRKLLAATAQLRQKINQREARTTTPPSALVGESSGRRSGSPGH